VTLLTVTPPVTAAEMWFGYPGPPVSGPGSKNPEPADDVPVMITLTELCPVETLEGDAAEGAAGGGAISFMTRVAQELVELAYSCTVHRVMSSVGSITVCEKSPQRCGFVTVMS